MSLRLDRLWLILGLFVAGETFALGLGDIRLNSALNEPLRAEIQLISATPEDLASLKVALASSDTFDRYGLHRPLYLTRLEFTVAPSGANGSVVRVTSEDPITEPFVTFLVEASWPRGRLLREYTVLLDPPTFAPPPASESQAVTAPSRAQPADRGRIERPAGPAAAPQEERYDPPASFDTTAGDEVRVERGDTLWGIAERVRPDDRLGMNQTMLAIYEANPRAFGGNINLLNAGTSLRIPSPDEIYRISRGEAMSEVQRQNAAFGLAVPTRTEPRLTLVPPDGDQEPYAGASGGGGGESADAGTPARIRELEETIAEQQSLIEVRDDELARLRDELARIREQAASQAGAEAPAAATPETAAVPDEPAAAEETDRVFADDTGPDAGEEPAEQAAADEEESAPAPAATTGRVRAETAEEPGIIDRIVDILSGFWGILGAVLVLVLGTLLWFAKRAAGRGEEESTGVWDALDAGDDVDSESLASTERLRALARDDDSSIVVVEQETSAGQRAQGRPAPAVDATAETGTHPGLEDTFSSETAINLDQSDPVAEADFHMAYGLYDQAADLINGALAVEPERQDLMAKLCDIYFVWGNRDAFVDAASRLHDQLGGEATPDWDKIVIMGQQIAGDHRLFSGVTAGSATRAVDLSLDSGDGGAELDMDFASGPDGSVSDVVDLGGSDDASSAEGDRSGLDFVFDDELDTGASTTREMPGADDLDATIESTVESPTIESPAAESTVESPTIKQSYDGGESTAESRAMKDPASDATAEIDLDDLGLNLDDLAASGLADLDDDHGAGDFSDLDVTTESGVLAANDDAEATGRNFALDDDDPETAETGIHEDFNLDDAFAETGEMPAFDEATGRNPALRGIDEQSETDVDLDVDATLLDATGQTQVLRDDFGPNEDTIGDNDKTMLASLDQDDLYAATAALSSDDIDGDFDFAKTEALPKSAFNGDPSQDETSEIPSLAGGTDVDLDLDDLTAALRISEGDTVDQPRDDATVEQPHLKGKSVVDLDVGDLLDGYDNVPTEALSPEEFSDDLHEARTMTEVGTKLDLARAYVDMGDPDGARSILEEVLEEGDDGQRQQAQKLIETLPA